MVQPKLFLNLHRRNTTPERLPSSSTRNTVKTTSKIFMAGGFISSKNEASHSCQRYRYADLQTCLTDGNSRKNSAETAVSAESESPTVRLFFENQVVFAISPPPSAIRPGFENRRHVVGRESRACAEHSIPNTPSPSPERRSTWLLSVFSLLSFRCIPAGVASNDPVSSENVIANRNGTQGVSETVKHRIVLNAIPTRDCPRPCR